MNAPEEQRYPRREPVDNCFNFILENIDYAINNGLPQSVTSNEWGRITTLIAKSLKSRILLYRASPIFNGNEDYSNFKDSDGTILVNTVYDAENGKQRQIFLSKLSKWLKRKALSFTNVQQTVH